MIILTVSILPIAAAVVLPRLFAAPANAQRFNPFRQDNYTHLIEIIPPSAYSLYQWLVCFRQASRGPELPAR